MKNENNDVLEGGCTCGEVRYRLTRSPIVVNCCHCRWCQRETGTAFEEYYRRSEQLSEASLKRLSELAVGNQ